MLRRSALFSVLLAVGFAIQLDIEPHTTRCITEEMAEDALGKFTFHVVSNEELTPEACHP